MVRATLAFEELAVVGHIIYAREDLLEVSKSKLLLFEI